MRSILVLILLGPAFLPTPPARERAAESYRLHVSWYESDSVPCCEVPPPLNETDSVEMVVRPRERFETKYRSGNRHMGVIGQLTPLPRDEFQLDIEWSQVVDVPVEGSPIPIRTVKRVSNSVHGLAVGIECELARLASSSTKRRSETETVFRSQEVVVAVTVSPARFKR